LNKEVLDGVHEQKIVNLQILPEVAAGFGLSDAEIVPATKRMITSTIKRVIPGILSLLPAVSAFAQDPFALIDPNERIKGPQGSNAVPNLQTQGAGDSASIILRPAQVVQTNLSLLHYGGCLEDLNHEIYGGLYAQLIYGESFEEGPAVEVPDSMETFNGLNYCKGYREFNEGVISLLGYRFFQVVWKEAELGDGSLECDVMQPGRDPGLSVAVMFRIQMLQEPLNGSRIDQFYALNMNFAERAVSLTRGESIWAKKKTLATQKLSIAYDKWHHIKIVVKGGLIQMSIDGSQVPQITCQDAAPLPPGLVGFDATEARGHFRNVRVESSGKLWVAEIPSDDKNGTGRISEWWDKVVVGDAKAHYDLDSDNPYNSSRSQKVEFRSGTRGTVGIANRGLNRWGIAFKANHSYEGRLYLRGDCPSGVTVALQDANGTKTYASKVFTGIGSNWNKYSFSLTSSETDNNGCFAIWLSNPGTVWVDQAVLLPAVGDRYKGTLMRADIGHAIVAAGITTIRVGGDAINPPGWRWKNLIGDPDKRPQFNHPWYPFQTGGFGVDEYLRFCEASGIEPLWGLNGGETAQDAADFIEYCNGPATSKWGKKRAENGHPKTYGITYVQLGNGFAGVDHTAAVAEAMHRVDPRIRLLGGALTHHVAHVPADDFMKDLAARFDGKVYAISVLPYNDQPGDALRWGHLVDRLQSTIKQVNPNSSLRLFSQEVNGGRHDLQRALNDVQYLQVSERHNDFVQVMSYCNLLAADKQLQNGWEQGRIYFNNSEAWLQPSAISMAMARRHYQPHLVWSESSGPAMEAAAYPDEKHTIDRLSVTATRNDLGDVLVIKAVNVGDRPLQTAIKIEGIGAVNPVATVMTLRGPGLNADNTFEQQGNVSAAESRIFNAGREFLYRLPAKSFTILRLEGVKLPGAP
jgi:alpha-L-arabinofuranosidase